MEPLPKGANFVRAKMLWEIGLHIAGNPATPYGGDRDMQITVGSGGAPRSRPGCAWPPAPPSSPRRSPRRCRDGVRQSLRAADPGLSRRRRVQEAAAGAGGRELSELGPVLITVHPRTGIRSISDIVEKRYPLRVSVREDTDPFDPCADRPVAVASRLHARRHRGLGRQARRWRLAHTTRGGWPRSSRRDRCGLRRGDHDVARRGP